MPSELDLILQRIDETKASVKDLSDKFDTLCTTTNTTNTALATHLTQYKNCKEECLLQHKVIFGNGDAEKGMLFKVIELWKWKAGYNKFFWLVIGGFLTIALNAISPTIKDYVYGAAPNDPVTHVAGPDIKAQP